MAGVESGTPRGATPVGVWGGPEREDDARAGLPILRLGGGAEGRFALPFVCLVGLIDGR